MHCAHVSFDSHVHPAYCGWLSGRAKRLNFGALTFVFGDLELEEGHHLLGAAMQGSSNDTPVSFRIRERASHQRTCTRTGREQTDALDGANLGRVGACFSLHFGLRQNNTLASLGTRGSSRWVLWIEILVDQPAGTDYEDEPLQQCGKSTAAAGRGLQPAALMRCVVTVVLHRTVIGVGAADAVARAAEARVVAVAVCARVAQAVRFPEESAVRGRSRARGPEREN